jgi:hypothetical protein
MPLSATMSGGELVLTVAVPQAVSAAHASAALPARRRFRLKPMLQGRAASLKLLTGRAEFPVIRAGGMKEL